MNKKIRNFILGVTIILLFFALIVFLLAITFANSLTLGIVLLILFYLFNFSFYFDLFSKPRSTEQAKISWTITFVLLPGIGGVLYYLAGYVPKAKKLKLERIFLLESDLAQQPKYTIDLKPKDYHPLFQLNYGNQNRQLISNSSIEFLNGAKAKYQKLFDEIANAQEFIHIQYFIINDGIIWNNFKKLLIKKSEQGVKIKILVDYIGCIQTDDNAYKDFKYTRIKFIQFNPTKFYIKNGYINFRSHNKFIIIDNKISYFGGMNIGDDYGSLYSKYGVWYDMQIRCQGEIVNEMNNHFITQWYLATDKMIKEAKIVNFNNKINLQFFSDGPNNREPVFIKYLLYLINTAERDIKIVSPYLIFPKNILVALKKAAQRGVKIEIITAGRADKRTAYAIGKLYVNDLIKSNIKVYRTVNSFIHSKFYLFDEDKIIVGTTNLDYRALYLHFESNLLIVDFEKRKELEDIFNEYKQNSYLEEKSDSILFLRIKRFFYLFIAPIF